MKRILAMKQNLPQPEYFRFEEISVGQTAAFERTINDRDLQLFAEITGDFNPLHFDDEYARQTQFGGRIIPGLLTASFLSRLIGMMLPGRQALYLSQDFKFIKPVYIGDRLTITGTVIEKLPGSKNCMLLKTDIVNQDKNLVVTGTAKVMVRD